MDEVEAITDGGACTGGSRCRCPATRWRGSRSTVNGMLARLEQSFASLHRFTADASHELKTPLMVLRAGVERALVHPGVRRRDPPVAGRDAGADQPDDGAGGEPADAGARRRGAGAARGRGVATCGTCSATWPRPRGCWARGVGRSRVHQQMPRAPVRLAVDRHRIREMLLNLVTNAIKYTPHGRHGRPRAWPSRTTARQLHRARHRHRHRRRRPAAHLRPVLAGRPGALAHRRAARAPASAWPSPSGSRRRTADPSRCRAGRGGARSSRCGCRASVRRPALTPCRSGDSSISESRSRHDVSRQR